MPSIPSGTGLRLVPMTLDMDIIKVSQMVCSSRTLTMRLGFVTLVVNLCVRREDNILLSNIPVIYMLVS